MSGKHAIYNTSTLAAGRTPEPRDAKSGFRNAHWWQDWSQHPQDPPDFERRPLSHIFNKLALEIS